MNVLSVLLRRNVKLFFRDKGMFFTALITPLILLVLYATFLGNVYRDSFLLTVPEGMAVADSLLNGFVGGQLISSILAVSCVTVAFCSNMLMVQDKVTGARSDLTVSPVKPSLLAVSYFGATWLSTLLICFVAAVACLVYVACVGWYMTLGEVLLLLLDVLLLSLFGTALSSVINYFLSTQGQISAVGSIISSVYGFICGAYMPISQFPEGLQKAIAFLPGTYGTALMRNHALQGVAVAMEEEGLPQEAITAMLDAVDCRVYFFDTVVPVPVMYGILLGSIALLLGIYILLNYRRIRKMQ
ncbi:MAG: ABC transporter permease [Clostridia bacterium]|nr:ABC transporter permease [Clostridia bacterium]